MPPALPTLARWAEAAGLQASAAPGEAELEGWLLRLSPGKAKRSRCINPLAAGTLALDTLLQRCQQAFAAAQLPLYVRLTPFSQPAELDALLAQRGWVEEDPADVLVLADLAPRAPLPPQLHLQPLSATAYAAQVGAWRGSTDTEIQAHIERMALAPQPYQAFELRHADGRVLAGGQICLSTPTHEAPTLVGLFDIYTPAAQRRQGWARHFCRALLQHAAGQGAAHAYLQVGCDNHAAQALYRALGFVWAYRYHYRRPPA
ncbi:GNAT family N-acetyltransferase [Roseateles sp. BYS180W]|uniref:GNAT family N-acetyltransferase n=1 Tax=Roseateles rivi TaxID=3299028 RepID=A0ABW7FTY5_9BURK